MKNFRTYDLAKRFYQLCKELPLTGPARDQLRRASMSIGLNLKEGRGRHTEKDELRFFHIAIGSLRECQAVLEMEELTDTVQYKIADELGAALYCLIRRTNGG